MDAAFGEESNWGHRAPTVRALAQIRVRSRTPADILRSGVLSPHAYCAYRYTILNGEKRNV